MSAQILNKVAVKNFKIFRASYEFDLGKGTYLVGTNNSGKSTVLLAIRYFFEDELYAGKDFLNKTEAARKRSGSNKSEVGVTFNLDAVLKRNLRETLQKDYGKEITVTKVATQTDLGVIKIQYRLGSRLHSFEKLPETIQQLISSIRLNYIHPQQGAQLLEEAQQKLKRRLLDNWGRAGSVTQGVRKLEEQWSKFRETAKQYLSEGLNANMQKVWPDSEITVALPADIKEILAVSDISYSSYKGAPLIDLLSQGSGAQSLILYFTHYMLDIDRTLHRASEYHPVWLIEEPESFMHADLISKLAEEFNSEDWNEKIQLIISTHSSIMLARSRKIGEGAMWHVLTQHDKISKLSVGWNKEEIKSIGTLLGDNNFYDYFLSSLDSKPILLEDSREATIDAFESSGIKVQAGLGSISQVAKSIQSLLPLSDTISAKPIFIVDNDDGIKELKASGIYLDGSRIVKEVNGFKLIDVNNHSVIFLIMLPEEFASENLFDEFDTFIVACTNAIFDTKTKSLKRGYPNYLAGAVAGLYQVKDDQINEELIKNKIKSTSAAKQEFWRRVEVQRLSINTKASEAIKQLIEAA